MEPRRTDTVDAQPKDGGMRFVFPPYACSKIWLDDQKMELGVICGGGRNIAIFAVGI